MYIVSKFQDYYDKGAAWGIDKKKTFNREQKEFYQELRLPNLDRASAISLTNLLYGTRSLRSNPCFTGGFLFFCGKLYPFFKISFTKGTFTRSDYEHKVTYIFNKEQEENLDSDIKEAIEHENNLTSLDLRSINKHQHFYKIIDEIARLVKESGIENKIKEYAEEERLAYFIFKLDTSFTDQGKLKFEGLTYPNLKDYCFSKVLDPFMAFSQIEQYLFNITDMDGDIEISDKDKAQAHGHDGKYSFKKTPEAK
tara:strand:- start:39907 stop:40665 length:759 start_codon:yes stop_codon:yes gene_type:complete